MNTSNKAPFDKLIGQAPALEAVKRTAQIIAATDVPVLIEGETGTGKELMAQAIHDISTRNNHTIVAVNCAALPVQLSESLFFGHERGAFTNAVTRKNGYAHRADGGTLFLDEIGELPLALQAKLLRFIESGEFQRLGSCNTENVNTRIIAATNRNLLSMVDNGMFRQDLFYRLNIVSLRMPSLKERRSDIVALADFFLQQAAHRNNTQPAVMTNCAKTALNKHSWPGNARELRNVCERLAAFFSGKKITADNLPIEMGSKETTTGFRLPETGINIESLEIDCMHQALQHSAGNKSQAARLLGLSRDAFLYRMKKYHL